MTKKIVDKFTMEIVPTTSPQDTKQFEDNIEKATEDGTSAGLKKGSKSVFNKANFLKIGASLGAVIASAIAIGVKTTNETVDNIRNQLDVADTLATRASQTGLELEKFLKLQKLFEFGDVAPEIASQAIVEFEYF